MKKLIIVFLVLGAFVWSIPKIFGIFAKCYFKKVFKEEVSYQSSGFSKGRLLIKDIKSSSLNWDIFIKEISFKPSFFLKKNIFLIKSPKIICKRREVFTKEDFFKKRPFFKNCKILIENGSFFYKKKIHFSKDFIGKKDIVKLRFFEEEITLENGEENIGIFFKDVDLKNVRFLTKFLELKHPVKKMSGKINGKIFLSKKNLLDMDCDIKVEDLFFIEKYFKRKIFAKIFQLNKKGSFIKSSLKDGNIENWKEFFGDFSFDPKIGPKINVHINDEKNNPLSIISEGYVKDNWAEFFLLYKEKKINFQFKPEKKLFLELKLQNMDFEIFSFFNIFLKKFLKVEMEKGKFSLFLKTCLKKDFWKKDSSFIDILENIEIKDLFAENIEGKYREKKFSFKNFQGFISYDKEKSFSSDFSFKEGFFGKNHLKEMTVVSKEGGVERGFFKGVFLGYEIESFFKGDWNNFFQKIQVKKEHTENFFGNCFIRVDNGFIDFQGIIKNNQESCVFGLGVKNFRELLLKKAFLDMDILEKNIPYFWFRGDEIILDRFSFLPFKISGTSDISVDFKEGFFQIAFLGEDIRYEDNVITVDVKKIGNNLFCFDRKKKSWKINAEDIDGDLFLKNFNKKFQCRKSCCFLEDNLFKVTFLDVASGTLSLSADMHLDLFLGKLDLFIKKAKGELDDIKEVLKGWDIFLDEKIKGFFKISKNFYFSKILSKKENVYKGDIHFYDISYKGKNFQIKDGEIVVKDFSKETADIDVFGKISVYKKKYEFFSNVQKEKQDLRYGLKIQEDKEEISRIRGKAVFKDGITFYVDKKSYALGFLLNISSLFLDKNYHLQSLKMNPQFKSKDEEIFGDIFLKDKKIFFKGFSKNCSFFSKKFSKFFLFGTYEDKICNIEKLEMDDVIAKFFIDFREKKGSASFKEKDSYADIEAVYLDDKIDIHIKDMYLCRSNFLKKMILLDVREEVVSLKGWVSCIFKDNFFYQADLDIINMKGYFKDIFFENTHGFPVRYDSQKGMEIYGLDMNYHIKDEVKKIQVKKITYDFFLWNFLGSRVFLSKNILDFFQKPFFKKILALEEDLDCFMDIKFFPKKNLWEIFMKKGFIFIKNKKREVKNFTMAVEGEKISFNFLFFYKGMYHPMRGGVKKDRGEVFIGDLKIDFLLEDGVEIKRIFGKYLGLKMDLLQKNKRSLFGNIDIDFTKLPLNTFLKDGYSLKGEMFLSEDGFFEGFEGEFFGKNFKLLDCTLKTLHGKLKIIKKNIEIKDIKLSDHAGILDIKNIFLNKIDGRWKFFVPHVQGREIRPSLLQNDKKTEIKPLVIRDWNLYFLSGFLDDLSSITGKGYFSFINSFKRGFNVIEIPADFLGRILGLDSEILIPVRGKVFFRIEKEKFLIEKISDVYSENNRSKFFLVETPYMDFQGEINAYIKMKQYVLFKITEKFILSIQGNIKEPNFNLKKKKNWKLKK